MPWTKIDDRFHDHPKVIAAGSEGVALFILGLSWCGGSLTDGFIPEAQVRRLSLSDNSSDIAERLVEVGLWERRNGGYQVHDYLEYNPSAAQVKAQRATSAERQARWRGKQEPPEPESGGDGNNNGVTNGVIEAVTNAVTNAAPVPVPVPVPVPDPIPEPASAEPAKTPEAQAPAPAPATTTPRRKSRKKPRTPVPLAVRVFRENAHRYPARAWYTDVAQAVGDDPSNLELWGQVIKAYVGLGWNPTNVSNMLEFYQRREIPSNNKGKGDANSTRNRPAGFVGSTATAQDHNDPTPEEIAEFQAAVDAHARRRREQAAGAVPG